MKIVFITGSHPRHAFIARALADTGLLAGLIIEQREEHVPVAPDYISDELKALFIKHFTKRQETELRFFKEGHFPDVPKIVVTKEQLNTEVTWQFLEDKQPDLLLSYGCHKLTEQSLSKVKGEKWNIHGGLSPWYRGAITHFWPSYMLEPQMTGMTIHELTEQLDAGDVIHQCTADLVRGDGVHDLAARAVIKVAYELPKLISILLENREIKKVAHRSTGKLWRGSDWKPEHLYLIYELYGDRVVDSVLDSQSQPMIPKLIKQF